MKQHKLREYTPRYPKKLLKGTALAAAALMAVGSAGCKARPDSAGTSVPTEVPATEAPEELVLDGEIAIEDLPPENLVEPGEPAVDEGDDIITDGPLPDEYVDEYGDPLLGGEPLPDPSWEEENDHAEEPTPDEPEERDGEEPALMGKIVVPDDMP